MKLIEIEHLAVAVIAMALAAMAQLGVHIPGVSIDPTAAMAFAIGSFAGGFAKGKIKSADNNTASAPDKK